MVSHGHSYPLAPARFWKIATVEPGHRGLARPGWSGEDQVARDGWGGQAGPDPGRDVGEQVDELGDLALDGAEPDHPVQRGEQTVHFGAPVTAGASGHGLG